MSTPEARILRQRLSAARIAIVTLLGALEKIRDRLAGGDIAGARNEAENALFDADAYLQLVDEPASE
jgi:hypothetical protein